MSGTHRVTIVQTHPAQYMAPWFRYMAAERRDIDLTVLYASTPTPAQQGVGFDQSFAWDVGLTEGYNCTVLAEPHPGRTFDSGSFTGADVGSIGDAIAATRPDAVVVPGWHSMFYLRAIAACRRANIPVLYRGDSNLLTGPHGLRRLPWSLRTRAALKMFDGYLSVGTRIREYLRHFGAPEPLIFDSPHCVDNAAFAAGADCLGTGGAWQQARQEMGAGPGDFLILFAGKFVEPKRPCDVIAAAARLGPDVVVAMAGNGPSIDATREAAKRLNVRVTWCGFLNQTAMPRALAAADCVAVPSETESWGLIVNEALATGTPCVVSSGVGCATDLVRAGVSGAVYEVGDIDGLAASLRQVREAALGGAITAETCRRVVAPFSIERATDGLVAATKRVNARKRTAQTSHAGHPRVLAAFGNMAMVSGVERMSFEVLRTLRERGAAVHCIVNSWESSKVVDLADSVGASWSLGYYWYELRRRARLHQRVLALWDVCRTSVDLLRDVRRFRPTHVFTPEYHAVLRSAPALWLARRAGIRVVLRLGNAPEPGRFYRMLWRRVIDRCVDRYVPNSRFIEQELLAHGIDRGKVRVIYNTVPYRGTEWGTSQPVPGRIVYVGQIIPPKGLDVLLDAVALLAQRGYEVTLDVVGAIDAWEAPGYEGYRERIRQRADAADLAGRVRFLGQREDVPALMAQASVHCMPSRPEQKEGFAVVALEAKRAGLPSVVTHSGALPEMVRHAVDGWVCPDVTAAAIAEGLAHFLSDPDRARSAGEQARASERLYNRDRFAAEWADMFSAGEHAVPSPVRVRSS
ncbi:MAG TPA: glycosyltransferase family 4 protein [Vicinamibacterales bacterium]|nr:glycosyltransferase family 4 protein [Vicinamibacterales bacterium]